MTTTKDESKDRDEEMVVDVQDLEVTESGEIHIEPKSSDANENSNGEETSSSSKITKESDLSDKNRRIWVVTTAALPWRTGTAVNPLLRALTLTQGRPKDHVTLMVPWLTDAAHRKKLYNDEEFESPKEQEDYIRKYSKDRCCKDPKEAENLRIRFYEGSYSESFGSIFPTQDICSLIPLDEADVAILEEPEHLNWFRVPNFDGDEDEKVSLGWAHMFQHVVGILHTNYAEYIREYSMGASVVTAPALNSLSSLVVRAYCHQVIRLSATLPSLCDKEVTSNVHGVRPEFLDEPKPEKDRDVDALAPVYFIGKVIWAKGFDSVLALQERFKEETGDYFQMDIYGTGNDEAAIQRACFGRKAGLGSPTAEPLTSDDEGRGGTGAEYEPVSANDVFGKPTSLRSIIYGDNLLTPAPTHNHDSTDDDSDATSNADNDETPYASDSEVGGNVTAGDRGEVGTEAKNETKAATATADKKENTVISILTDASGKAFNTGVETAAATATLLESAVKAVFSHGHRGKRQKDRTPKVKKSTSMNLVPLRARYKWRSSPLPTRFMGTKDHSLLRDVPEHTIFLNMSTTEVLCTTSAEALAMGKYVILPKHPSNEFFYQFPNCLAYEDIDDCVAKLQYALLNRPEYLADKHVHMLSWHGATERLFKASAITEAEMARRTESGMVAADEKAAKFHVDGASKSHMLKKIISGGGLLSKKSGSSSSLKDDSEKGGSTGAGKETSD
ncbi:hypothetical protein MPSEU_001096600 [Mayamaea pseudoterrestris]|nr:hypothetical protein MPSEU_001096600 [Mayamaea pseudoterrestris]